MFLSSSTILNSRYSKALIILLIFATVLSHTLAYASDVRAKDVEIDYKGQLIRITAIEANTVKDVLEQSGIKLTENDAVVPSLDTPLNNVSNIQITGEKFKEVIHTDKIETDYETIRVANNKLPRGKEVIVTPGEKGTITKTYFVVYYNGEKLSTTYLGSEVTKEPVDEVIQYGTAEPLVLTSRGSHQRYTAVYDMMATAYTAGAESTGKNPGDYGYGITASGMYVAPGVIAVDPSVIPLGTRLYIEGKNGETLPNNGYAIAADTGGAIVGNKIDIYMETVSECMSWGYRGVKVYVLE